MTENIPNFVYRDPLNEHGHPISPIISVKFSQNLMICDDYYVIGGDKWSRFMYRMLNFPWIATKRVCKYVGRKLFRGKAQRL